MEIEAKKLLDDATEKENVASCGSARRFFTVCHVYILQNVKFYLLFDVKTAERRTDNSAELCVFGDEELDAEHGRQPCKRLLGVGDRGEVAR